jgi:polygalacturonase
MRPARCFALLLTLGVNLRVLECCSIADFGAVADNATDNTLAFRRAAKACAGGELLVPAGTWMTGPFNLSSNTVLRVEGTISGSVVPEVYPIVTLQPVSGQ